MRSIFNDDCRSLATAETEPRDADACIGPFDLGQVPVLPGTRSSLLDEDLTSLLDEFETQKTAVSNYASRRLNVLVVDDDPSFAHTCARFLEAAGHITAIAADAQTAIQLGRERRFDAVVTDINLPDGNGLQVLQNLRLCDANLPFVLVTGDPQLDTARAAVECGAISYLLKPVTAMQLESVVERAFKARQMADLLRAASRREDEQRLLRETFDRALAGLWIAFQPIVSWSGKGIAGYEALLRTNEPSLASPADLLKAATELQQLVPLGQRIRRQVAAVMFGHDAVPAVFVNLHALELLDDELYDPYSPLAAVADHVFFEITEQTALTDTADFIRRTKRLRAMGYRIAVSDIAGAGSGLGSLAFLEPDVVKLEMELLRQFDEPVRRRLTHAAIALCHELGIPMIAEGVETEAERNEFVANGGDLMQGFLFGRPDFPLPTPSF
jgi:EAL domain-containing protein (putative c-di-GMP-specific phosphodiesterase class I)